MEDYFSVVIAGAGLAGLCLGQALVRAGIEVEIYERDASPMARCQGYRLTMDEHGAAALKSCLPPQLFEAVLATASPLGAVGYFRFTNQHLGEIFKLTFKRDPQRVGRQMLGQVDRSTLRTIMLSGIKDRVHFGKAASRIESTPESAVLHFTDGTAARASVIVGADGIHSVPRRQVLPDCAVTDTGALGIYGKTPLIKDGISLLPVSLENSGVMAIGDAPGRAFFFTAMQFKEAPVEVFKRLVPDQEPPMSGDYIMWAMLFPKTELPSDFADLDCASLHHLAMGAVQAYHPVLRRFVEHAEMDYTVAVAISAATKPADWPLSRVTLIGDAIHAMPPTGAHGGNTALRDAACLAEELRKTAAGGQSLEQAIDGYQREMLDYSFKEVTRSVAMLKRSNMRNPVERFIMLHAVPWWRSLVGTPLAIE